MKINNEIHEQQVEKSHPVLPSDTKLTAIPYDRYLLERVVTQWQFGDWESLRELDRETLEHHPDRARIVLFAAAARLRNGIQDSGREYLRLASEWGCSKKQIAQMLAASAHEHIANANLLVSRSDRARLHLERALTTAMPGSETRLLAQVRFSRCIANLEKYGLEIGQEATASVAISAADSKRSHAELDRSLNDLSPIYAAGQLFNHAGNGLDGVPLQEKLDSELYTVLSQVHEIIKPRFYLEIGVGEGKSLALAKCKALGIDPAPQYRMSFGANVQTIQASSDEFFANRENDWIRSQPLDFAKISGVPLVDYVLRSLVSLESIALESTLMVVPGIYPRTRESSTRFRAIGDWWGDIWKLPSLLRDFRPDLRLLELNVEPAGLLLITGFNSKNKALTERRHEFAARIQSIDPASPSILHRKEAVVIGDARFKSFLQAIHSLKS